ncbi:terminase small subunit [Solibacillus sp. FSL W8-0474]|uniref:terminase small subunit n=1 Tax=Solibacillus sp. FSL W8-0474 TaxID=2975336 RepID=UPI0030F9CB31
MAKEVKLTIKQRKFADYYIECGNATEAAIRAGYSKNSARFIAAENLAKPLIKEYIEQVMAIKDAERIANQDEILAFLTSVMRGEVKEQVPLLDGDGYQKLQTLDAAQPKDRIKAAELLGKRHAMWTEKQQVEGDLSVNIVVDYGDDEQ